MRKYNWRLETIFPPGYDYQTVCSRLKLLWGIAVGYSIRFFFDFYKACERLYYWRTGTTGILNEKYIPQGSKIATFPEIAWNSFLFFIPLLLVLIAEGIMHYMYYSQGSRSILLVCRLPKRGFLWRTCVAAPALGVAITVLTAGILSLIYYGVYVIFTPAGCLP